MDSNKNASLDAAITALKSIERAVDLRWLAEEIHARLNSSYNAKLHGIKGGHYDYPRSRALYAAYDAAANLLPADLGTLALVVDLAYRLMQPQADDDTRGSVQLKTIIKRFPVIDWAATGDSKGGLVYVLGDDGAPVMQPFPYTYAYVRQYASKGDANRKRRTLLSLYADRGMGKGGSGGVVAAALQDNRITEDDILDAWHQGKAAYQQFIDHCTSLLGLGQDSELPNPDEGGEAE